MLKDLDGEDDYDEEEDLVDELDGKALKPQASTTSESIINQNRRISSCIRIQKNNRLKQIPPKKHGILQKWSPSLFAGYQDRFITLENKVLTYFKEEKKGVPSMQGVLNFDLYACSLHSVDGKP